MAETTLVWEAANGNLNGVREHVRLFERAHWVLPPDSVVRDEFEITPGHFSDLF
jgi:hypothetical protein